MDQREFVELVAASRTYRRFDEARPVTHEQLEALVGAARVAPSANNRQRLRFHLSVGPEALLVESHHRWAALLKDWDGPVEGERPTGYVTIVGPEGARTNGMVNQDAGIAAQTIMLAARAAGLVGCMVASFDAELGPALGLAERWSSSLPPPSTVSPTGATPTACTTCPSSPWRIFSSRGGTAVSENRRPSRARAGCRPGIGDLLRRRARNPGIPGRPGEKVAEFWTTLREPRRFRDAFFSPGGNPCDSGTAAAPGCGTPPIPGPPGRAGERDGAGGVSILLRKFDIVRRARNSGAHSTLGDGRGASPDTGRPVPPSGKGVTTRQSIGGRTLT